jgi:hypothetical protein
MARIRTYLELSRYDTFEDRFDYLRLKGIVGNQTFGFDRWVNQRFYKSREWMDVRDYVIVRDDGCDLGIPGRELHSGLIVHHMNPIILDDIIEHQEWILDPNFLITTSLKTHNAIHYGDERHLPSVLIERRAKDTQLWWERRDKWNQ